MINDQLALNICLWGANYFLLSTLFIAAGWSFQRLRIVRTCVSRDLLWKFVLVAPLIISFIQLGYSRDSGRLNVAALLPVAFDLVRNAGAIEDISTIQTELMTESSNRGVDVMPRIELYEGQDTREKRSQLSHSQILSITPYQAETPLNSNTAESLPNQSIDRQVSTQQEISEATTVVPAAAQRGFQQNQFLKPSNVAKQPASIIAVEDVTQMISSAILFCLCLGTLKLLWKLILFRKQRRSWQVVNSPEIHSCLHRLQDLFGITGEVHVLTSDERSEPAVCGVLSPIIVLPTGIEERLSQEELDALLAHELAHLQRRDPIWNLVFSLIANCFIWQPFNYYTIRQWRATAEVCCDKIALSRGVDRFTLARCLTRVASWKLSPQTNLALSAAKNDLSERVERLVEENAVSEKGQIRFSNKCLIVLSMAASIALIPQLSWQQEVSASPTISIEPLNEKSEDEEILPSLQEPSASELSVIPPVLSEPESSTLASSATEALEEEVAALVTDLSYALDLLEEQEQDPEVRSAVRQVRERLARLTNDHQSQEGLPTESISTALDLLPLPSD